MDQNDFDDQSRVRGFFDDSDFDAAGELRNVGSVTSQSERVTAGSDDQ